MNPQPYKKICKKGHLSAMLSASGKKEFHKLKTFSLLCISVYSVLTPHKLAEV
jgi:hypothetical protein